MSDIVIKAESLGKKYVIGHQQKNGSYLTLRDTIMQNARTLWNKTKDLAKGKPVIQGDTWEDIWALRDVSFEIHRGDAVGIIGRNGAGKSTLLKILSRITEPSAGRVTIDGRVASLLEVGTGFHPELTGRENIYLNGTILGMTRKEIKQKFDEIVAFAEVEKYLDTPVKRYSSGMYVRLAFAVAAHLEPEILIVDEVLAVGDAAFQKKCLGKMGAVTTQGRTVLFVSHNMGAIRSLCRHTIVLDKGNKVFAGSTTQAIEQYLTDIQEKNSYDFDLSNIPRAGDFGSKLVFHRLRFNDGGGIWHGQPLEVEIDFECLADVDEVSFGVGFCTRDGVRIMTIDSDVPGKRFSFHKGQKGAARFTISEFLLAPDTYSLDVGSRSGDSYGLEYLPNFGNVFVAPTESTSSAIFLRESISGGYRPIAAWKIKDRTMP